MTGLLKKSPQKFVRSIAAKKVVALENLPVLTRAQIAARLSAKTKSGKVAEMSFRDAGIKQGAL